MLNFTINTQKKPPYQIFQMEKFLTHNYSKLLSITAHYTINLKQKNYILFQRSLFPFFSFFFLFLLLSPLSLSSSLFPRSFCFSQFHGLSSSTPRFVGQNFKAQMPLDNKSSSTSKCCHRYGGRA